MNTGEVITYVREAATVSTQSTEYTDTVIRRLLNHTMTTVFEPIIAGKRAGNWLHALQRTLTAGNPSVRLHPRHSALEQVDIRVGGASNSWIPLQEAIESETQDWAIVYSGATYPQAYSVRGNAINLVPAPVDNSVELRAKFYMRPSQLVQEQTAGQVTNVTGQVITVNSQPTDRNTGSALSGAVTIDVMESTGWAELTLFNAPATVSGNTLTVDPLFGLGRIEVGDYVRAAKQTDWPQIPESFHMTLGEIAAMTICRQRDMLDRAAALGQQASGSLQRFEGQLAPRTKATNHMPVQHGWR